MRKHHRALKIGTLSNLSIGLVFALAAVTIVLLVNSSMRRTALVEAEAKARIILDRNLATHTYFSQVMKPKLFEWTAPLRSGDYFEPSWMSSTYAIRKIDQYFKLLSPVDYYYKDAAMNARSPGNEADDYEKKFLEELNADEKLQVRSNVRMIGGLPCFVVLRRGEMMEESCLRCHGDPANAPRDLVRYYGPERSFHRKPGTPISAVSIRIPLAAAYAQADRFSWQLSGLLLAVLLCLFLAQWWLGKRLVFSPLAALRNKAHQIAADERYLGEEIALPFSRELRELTATFNEMSAGLRHSRDYLEERVQERTVELNATNELLEREISDRKEAEEERKQLIQDLQKALANAKTLRGLLPICASCKKVRDDKGYWNQIEAYIQDHSEAEFSHGLCPECIKKLFPELHGFREKERNGS